MIYLRKMTVEFKWLHKTAEVVYSYDDRGTDCFKKIGIIILLYNFLPWLYMLVHH